MKSGWPTGTKAMVGKRVAPSLRVADCYTMTNNMVVYTFRTFPEIEKLKENFGEVFVFGKLKEDLEKFIKIIETKKPKYVLGVAKTKNVSQFEKYAINKFGQMGTINKNGLSKIELYVPKKIDKGFQISTKTTNSFCNWTMYKIGEYLLKYGLDIKFMFVHYSASRPPHSIKVKPLRGMLFRD